MILRKFSDIARASASHNSPRLLFPAHQMVSRVETDHLPKRQTIGHIVNANLRASDIFERCSNEADVTHFAFFSNYRKIATTGIDLSFYQI